MLDIDTGHKALCPLSRPMVVAKRAAMGTGGALTVPSHSMSLVAGRRASVIVMMGGSRATLVAHD
jgi:hypothetical protein